MADKDADWSIQTLRYDALAMGGCLERTLNGTSRGVFFHLIYTLVCMHNSLKYVGSVIQK